MRSGPLTRQIVIEQRASGLDAAGQPNGAWETFATVYADVKGATGMGSIRQAGIVGGDVAASMNSYSFRVHYRTDITDAMRVNMGGTYFDIKQVRHDHARRVWTDLVCEEGGNDG